MKAKGNQFIPMTFAGGPTYMVPPLKDKLKDNIFKQHSLLNVNSNTQQFRDIIQKARNNLRTILSIPSDHQIWFLSGGCHLQFAGIPLNFLGNNQIATANYTVTGHFSRLSFNEARKYCKAKAIIEPKLDEKGQFYLPLQYDFDQNAVYTHLVENQSVQGIYYKDEKFPVVQGIPLFNDCSSSFLTREIDWSKVDMAYAHAQKNCGISGLTIMILNQRALQTNPRSILPQVCSFESYKNKNGINSEGNILPIYSNYVFTQNLKGQGGLHKNNYEKRAKRLYEVIDGHQMYKARVSEDFRSPITVTWNIEDQSMLKKCMQEGAENGLHEFKGHRAIGGLRASLFCPIPDESVYRLADFLEDFAHKHQ